VEARKKITVMIKDNEIKYIRGTSKTIFDLRLGRRRSFVCTKRLIYLIFQVKSNFIEG
jgi:hypothetical protein